MPTKSCPNTYDHSLQIYIKSNHTNDKFLRVRSGGPCVSRSTTLLTHAVVLVTSWLFCSRVTCWSMDRPLVALPDRAICEDCGSCVGGSRICPGDLSLPRMIHTAVIKADVCSRIRSSLNTRGHPACLCGQANVQKILGSFKAALEKTLCEIQAGLGTSPCAMLNHPDTVESVHRAEL